MPEYIERESLISRLEAIKESENWDSMSRYVLFGIAEFIKNADAADVVAVETVKAWLYAIAMNNVGVKADDVASVCEDIAERMDGLRAFARERRGEDGTEN